MNKKSRNGVVSRETDIIQMLFPKLIRVPNHSLSQPSLECSGFHSFVIRFVESESTK